MFHVTVSMYADFKQNRKGWCFSLLHLTWNDPKGVLLPVGCDYQPRGGSPEPKKPIYLSEKFSHGRRHRSYVAPQQQKGHRYQAQRHHCFSNCDVVRKNNIHPTFHWDRILGHITCCHWLEWRHYAWFTSEYDHVWPLTIDIVSSTFGGHPKSLTFTAPYLGTYSG